MYRKQNSPTHEGKEEIPEWKYSVCVGTGALNISCELCSYLHIIAFTIMLKQMVSKPLKTFKTLQAVLHSLAALLSLVFVIVVVNTF